MLILDAAADNPEFSWEAQNRRYRNRQTGRFVSREAVYTLTRKRVDLAKQDLRVLGQLLVEGKINLQAWQVETAETLKVIHTQQYLLGVGGQRAMEKSDYLEIGRELKSQYRYLRNFAIELGEGEMTLAQFMARIEMYADASKVSYFRGEKTSAVRGGFTHGRRILSPIAEHCPECPQYAALGLVPISQLIMPTQACSCRVRCKCRIEFVNPSELSL